jgi:hypothetical protein
MATGMPSSRGGLALGGLGLGFFAQGEARRAQSLESAHDARVTLDRARTAAASANLLYATAGAAVLVRTGAGAAPPAGRRRGEPHLPLLTEPSLAARLPPRLLVLVTTLVAAACSLEVDDVADRQCADDTACPERYRCVDGSEGNGRCEVIYPPPSTVDAGADAGATP